MDSPLLQSRRWHNLSCHENDTPLESPMYVGTGKFRASFFNFEKVKKDEFLIKHGDLFCSNDVVRQKNLDYYLGIALFG